jgi:hypothetical protein
VSKPEKDSKVITMDFFLKKKFHLGKGNFSIELDLILNAIAISGDL